MMNELTSSQLLVLVERHLVLESRLAATLEEVNVASSQVFAQGGMRGPSQQELGTLGPMMDDVRKLATEVVEARQTILSRINRVLGTEFTRIKQYVNTLAPQQRARLNMTRQQILDQSRVAQANLIHNQAVVYYTFDYHRKYLAGVLQCDAEPQNYNASGQSGNVGPGNLLGKTC